MRLGSVSPRSIVARRTMGSELGGTVMDSSVRDDIRLAQLPRAGADRGAHRGRRLAADGNVQERAAGVARAQPFHPRDQELLFAQRQPVVVGELAVAGHGRPRRHVPPQHLGSHRQPLDPGLLVGGQRERQPALVVARHAAPLQQADDLAIEQHRGGDGPVRLPRSRHETCGSDRHEQDADGARGDRHRPAGSRTSNVVVKVCSTSPRRNCVHAR